MYNKARDIDVALFNVLIDDKFPKSFLSTALSGFQNKDGGFAHALGKEEFMTDELQLTAEEKMSLAMEINNLILGLNGF